MAQAERHDVDYFPHQCTHGRKMHIIETKYGNDGYACWHKLLEELGKANYHYIDISDEMNKMYLVSVFKVDYDKAICILNDLAKLGAIDRFLYEEKNIIYSQKFIDSIRDAYRKRKNKPLEYSALLNQINQKTTHSGGSMDEKPPIQAEFSPKEKKRKEKKRKEEKNKQNEGVFISSDSAYDFLKKEHPATMESFEMQNKKSFENYDVFIQNFESKIIEEGIPFEIEKLYARLTRLLANWNFAPKNQQYINQNQEPVNRPKPL